MELDKVHFVPINISRLLHTSGFNVEYIFKNQFDGILFLFSISKREQLHLVRMDNR